MKVLITGARGQLGSEIDDILQKKDGFIGKLSEEYKKCEWISFSSGDLDITDFEKAREIIEINRPDVLINCAAFTNVDGCEENLEMAMKVNAFGVKNLAIICSNLDTKLVHISTDYVFDGTSSKPYCEWDVCNPETVYGKSKLLGEQYVKEFTKKYFIVRTSWLYGAGGKNFLKTIINLSKTKNEISVVDDQFGNPTNANDLAYHILSLAITEEYGLYHCVGEGSCSWFDFASKICEYLNLSCKVIPVSTEEYQKIDFRAAKRPKNSALCNLALKALGLNKMPNWEESLKIFLSKYSFKE